MNALSPLDGRYREKTEELRELFSEEALMRARLAVEVFYFIALSGQPGVDDLPRLKKQQQTALLKIVENFNEKSAQEIKKIEKKTNHDVKAVEYYLKKKVGRIAGLRKHVEFIHFGLTSADVNNLAYGLLIHEALKDVIRPAVRSLTADLSGLARRWMTIPMLALTHGQPATPTTVGKELAVFVERLNRQFEQLKRLRLQGKLGGAVGNFSAHKAAYPKVNWPAFGRKFVRSLGLTPLTYTTQINPHDDLAELSHIMQRINTILLDLSRDMWLYISRGVFVQKLVAGEVGSSTMPHKVNPIDFENAEGNLGLSNALFGHFAEKLPVSRLQRDLSDSTVMRNIGVAFGHHSIAVQSLCKGLGKIELDRKALKRELEEHPEVIGEAIQMVLRKHGIPGGYEKMKKLTRGEKVTKEALLKFVEKLDLPKNEIKSLLKSFS